MIRTVSFFFLATVTTLFASACSNAEGPSSLSPATGPSPIGSATAVTASATVWKLQSFQRADTTNVPVPNPEKFTIEIGVDGRLAVRADCNRCSASYSSTDGSLRVNPLMACTTAACETGSFDREYLGALVNARVMSTGSNTLELVSSAGVLRFSR